MAQAKTLTNDQLNTVLKYVEKRSKQPVRDYVIVLLSFKAGLRAAEIAGLDWDDVTDAFGNIGQPGENGAMFLTIPADIAKKGHTRTVPMHNALRAALIALKGTTPAYLTKGSDPVVRGSIVPRMSANNLQQYVGRLYRSMGLQGCSSHSGRRSFITAAARAANNYGCSLKDVQRIAGHKYIDTTERYVDPSTQVAMLVGAL